MKQPENTIGALIKQIKAQKQPKTEDLSKILALLDQRVMRTENAIQSDAFKESVTLVYQTNMELIKTRNEMIVIQFCAGLLGGLIGTALFMAVFYG